MSYSPKILIHSIAFSPDGVSTAYLYNDIALAFQQKGYEVVVLTTTPHYNVLPEELAKQPMTKKLGGLYYTSSFNGIKVLHIPQKKFGSTALRILGFVYWHILSLILGLAEKRVSAILSPSPPLTIGFINLLIGKVKGAKVVYNVQEIYPDFLIEQGGLKSKPIIAALKWLEKLVYNKSDAVTTIDQVFYNTIVGRFKEPQKLHIIPNFVDTTLYRPLTNEEISLDNNLFVKNDTVKVMYAGNIGHAQDWEPLLSAAILLKDQPIEFYIIGEGVMKDHVIQQAKINGLNKVHILPYQPRESMPHLLAFSDLQFIFMSKEMEGHGFPSKVYTIMACAKPLIVCSGEKTPIVNFLQAQHCAKLITTRDFAEKVNEIVAFLKASSKESLRALGDAGYEEITKKYSKEVVTVDYIRLINKLI
ncbi:glycosyltransferase family 4 protein [Sphingobacterium sp. BIGb0165]|uniref:glycosyltransferase family 4 protein n=1 Tax=Sphingobacterium sp. BIGb0165 TaxID=2940615 RepID=UPI002167F7DD|nr:glycosyltransferase family 4 protein [Sphingobacterium sp. BIGb0165]